MTKYHIQLNLSRMLLRMVVYSMLLTVVLDWGWINPTGSIIHNIAGGFFVWVVPQLVVYFFLRGRDFGFSKGWLVRGVIFAILLTVFLNQGWINPANDYINNMIAGLTLYVVSYLGSWFVQ